MATDELIAFGPVLRRFRLAGGLTQEELADRAGVSVRAITDLERGVNKSPRAYTARQLAEALGLSGEDRSTFERAAQAGSTAPRIPDSPPQGDFLGALPANQLVAREEELERVRSILDAVAEGAGHLLLLSGEIGAGKTRLLQEVMVEARARGVLVLTGRCEGAEQAAPYYPVLEALAVLPQMAPEKVRMDCQRIGKKLRDFLDTFPADDGTAESGVAAQQRLFSAISDLLQLVAGVVPLAVLVDDLQWADSGSLKLLAYLARTTRGASVLLAGAFRDVRLSEEHPHLARVIQSLSRERLAERIAVRRLSLEETTQLAGFTMGQQEVSEEFASFVYRRTKGNPRLIDQLVRSLGGRLELRGEIGAGSMGRVFRAFDRATQRTVAAKLVLARVEIGLDMLLRFQQEGAVLAKLDHPHIVHTFETFVEEHASCVIMELLEGESLGQILQDGPLPLPRMKDLALQVAEALGYAHSQEIVHRDIKPDNVMVLDGDQVKVTDFGIARILQPDTSLQTIATTGMRMGTPLYMAPEQIEGKKIDGRTDIYALGAMLYHMVTGRPPFEGDDALTVAVKHLQEEPLPPSRMNPSLPQQWDALILKTLAKEPKARFQSAGEMEKMLAALPVEPVTDGAGGRARRQMRVALGGALSIAALAIAALLLATTVFRPHPASTEAQSVLGEKLDAYLTYLTNQHQMSGVVLVARRGQVILSKGYGLADREHHVANGPTVKYPLAGVGFSINLVATLKLEEEGKLRGSDHICTYLPHCPITWKRLTVRQVVAGTSHLFGINWNLLEGTTAQSLSACQNLALESVPVGRTSYRNCDVLVLGTIIEKVTHQPWESAIRSAVLDPAGMHDTARLTDALQPPARANDYNNTIPGAHYFFNPYFELYATPPDILRYDDALFGGKLLSPADLRTLLAPRDLSPDPGIPDARMAYKWKVGHLAGHQVIYTYDTTDFNLTTMNMRFPGDGTTVVIISNQRQADAEPIGVDLAKLVYGRAVIFPVPQSHVRAVPADRAIQATIDLGTAVAVAAFYHHTVWLPNDNINTVTRVDVRTNRIAGITPLSQILAGNSGDSLSVAGGGGQLWVIHNGAQEVVRLDPVSGRVTERVPVAGYTTDISVGNGAVWATSESADNVVRIDPNSRQVRHVGHAFGRPTELVASGGSVWVSSFLSATVRRIDARTNRVVATMHVGIDPEAIAIGYGSVWVVNGTGGYVSRIDPRTDKIISQISLGHDEANPNGDPCCHSITVGYGAVWVAVHKDRKLVRIDPTTNRATSQLTLPIPPQLASIDVWDVMAGDGSVWVHAEPHLLYRIDPKAMA